MTEKKVDITADPIIETRTLANRIVELKAEIESIGNMWSQAVEDAGNAQARCDEMYKTLTSTQQQLLAARTEIKKLKEALS